jgi:hypothetical protein
LHAPKAAASKHGFFSRDVHTFIFVEWFREVTL